MADRSDKSIDWDTFETAYGSAEGIGSLLDSIESGEDEWGELVGQLLHQGSLSSATAPASSVIIGFLERGAFSKMRGQRVWAFVFLSAAVSSATQTAKGLPISFEVLEALQEGCALYAAGITDPEVEVRIASAAIWKSVADDSAYAFASIAKQYERETECDARVVMLSALNELAGDGGGWLDQLSSRLSSATWVLEKFYAAAYLTIRLGGSAPENVANQLAKSYANLPEAEHPAWTTNLEEPEDLFWTAVRALKSRGVACLATTLGLWNEVFSSWTAGKLVNIMEWLLRLASNDQRLRWGGTSSSSGPKIVYFGVEPPSKDMDWLRLPEAAVALNAIAAKDEVWRIETNLLSLFNLPSGREELRELVRGFPPPSQQES